MNFEVIIGIEIHCELKTNTKMFSSSAVNTNAEVNTCVNEIDLAHPGILPSINKNAVKLAIKACTGLNCEIDPVLKFDRKNYFYSDLPKGFQITQQFFPIGKNGFVEIEIAKNQTKKIRINRIHLEEDTAKQHHLEKTFIDYNRAGVPLIEIVSEADIRSAYEAAKYVETIRSILEYLNVSDVKMEEGSMRCDINISLRPFGYNGFGTKVEIKNLNSISNIQKAIEYEIKLQEQLILANQEIVQSTKRYDEATKETKIMRKKEGAVDYRYFPEPNITPTKISLEWIQEIQNTMEELPQKKKQRYLKDYNLSEYDADVLIADKKLAFLFDETITHTSHYKLVANWITQDFSAYMNKNEQHSLNASELAILIEKIVANEISSKQAKIIFEEIMSGKKTEEVIIAKGMQQINDDTAIKDLIQKVLETNQQSIVDYHNGKDRALKYLVGQIMKESKGQVNPKLATELLLEVLKR